MTKNEPDDEALSEELADKLLAQLYIYEGHLSTGGALTAVSYVMHHLILQVSKDRKVPPEKTLNDFTKYIAKRLL